MNSKRASIYWLNLAVGFCAASNVAMAGSQVTFTDTWKDASAYDSANQVYYPKTTGSFSTKISLPLAGVDLSLADAGTTLALSIGPSGDTMQIISNALGNAQSYSAAKKSATFSLTDPYSLATVGSVTVSWTASTIAVTASATGDILAESGLFALNSDGTPANITFNSAIDGSYYEVALTLDASDNSGGTFTYDNPMVAVTGNNKETEYNPPDGSDPFPLEAGSISGAADFTPPTVSITSPAANSKVYDANPVINLKGKAADNVSVSDVECFVNGDTNNPVAIDQAGQLPTNSIAWTASVDLSQVGFVGTNVITVVATDTSGNQASVSRAFLWIETNAVVVTVNPPGAGTVKGLKNGQVLQVGNSYPVTATAANKTWIFSGWSDGGGNLLSANGSFEFFDVDTSSALTANFVPNPFNNTGLAGTYTGLFYDTTNGVDPSDAGYVTVTVTASGAFSGRLYLPTSPSPLPLSGQFSVAPDGSIAMAELPIKGSKTEYLDVNVLLATDPNLSDPGAGTLSGSVTFSSDPLGANQLAAAEIQGALSLPNIHIGAGVYNVVISPASGDPASSPGGYGYGSATVSKAGAVAVSLQLADGTSPAISFSTSLAQDGTCPVYASLYGGKGVFLGWMQFATDGSGAILQQSVTWVKQPVPGKYYTNGFAATPIIAGGLYIPPKAGTNIFGWTTGTFMVDPGYSGLSLPDEMDVPVTFNPAKNTFSNTNKVTITFTPASGALSGTFFYPAGSKTSFTWHGVEMGGAGYGFYATSTETGPVCIGDGSAP